jgi:hypothetical protein
LLVGNKPAIETGTRQITTPDESRAVVRELASGGVDIIKAVVDSGGRRSRPQRIPTLNAETLAAIVSEAQSLGLPVTVHSGNVDELPAIIAAHPTQIERAGYASIPQSLISEIAHAGIVVDPTLAVLSSQLRLKNLLPPLSTMFAAFMPPESSSPREPIRRSATHPSGKASSASSNYLWAQDSHRWQEFRQQPAGRRVC